MDAAHKVRSVTFRNVTVAGKRIGTADSECIRANEFVDDVRIE